MSATIHGMLNSEIYRQPGFTVSDADGTFTGSVVYALTLTAWNNASVRARFSIGNSLFTLDPDCPNLYRFLVIESTVPNYDNGDVVFVTVNLVGTELAQYSGESSGEGAITTYRLEGRLMDMSLSEHPKFKELEESERITLGHHLNGKVTYKSSGEEGEGYYWDDTGFILDPAEQVTSLNGIEFRNIILNGDTTYFVPTITWTETSQGSSAMTAAQLNKLGQVSTPRGNPPALTGGRTWMLTGATQEQRQTIYQTTIEWSVSERGGWNEFLYDT
jgi:hypothetical protein